MGARAQFLVDPSPVAIARVLSQLGERYRDWTPAWRRLAPGVALDVAQNILGQGAPLDATWAALSPAYKTWKARKAPGRAELVLTGALLAELEGAGGRTTIKPAMLRWGPSLRYPYVLNAGVASASSPAGRRTSARRARRKSQALAGKLAARPFLGWSEAMTSRAEAVLSEHAQALLADAAREIGGAG